MLCKQRWSQIQCKLLKNWPANSMLPIRQSIVNCRTLSTCRNSENEYPMRKRLNRSSSELTSAVLCSPVIEWWQGMKSRSSTITLHANGSGHLKEESRNCTKTGSISTLAKWCWVCVEINHFELLPRNQTINADVYCQRH